MIRRAPVVLVLVCALALPPSGAAAQEPPTRVIVLLDDLTGRPVEGADVSIEPGGLRRTSVRDGTFEVPLLGGAYVLRATALGYAELGVSIEVPTGATGPLVLRMTPAPFAVEGLDVEGEAASAPVDLYGVVLDAADGRPLVGATVAFPYGSRRWVALTEEDGTFGVSGVRQGVHWVRATHLGYEGVAVAVLMTPPAADPVEFRLRPDRALLQGVEALMTRWQTRRNAFARMPIRTVGRDRIAASPWWRDAGELLRSAGVTVVPCDDPSILGSCVVFRGLPQPMEVCIDGVMAVGGLDQLRTIHPRELHLVEVFGRGRLVHAYTVTFMESQARRARRAFDCPDPNTRW